MTTFAERTKATTDLQLAVKEMIAKETLRYTSELAFLKAVQATRGLLAESSVWEGPSKLSSRELRNILG